jgi:putative component of membrane protein insertase Oxa1/YidC/SpoIIIJ protein YidD
MAENQSAEGDWLWIKRIWKCGIFFVTLGSGGRGMRCEYRA